VTDDATLKALGVAHHGVSAGRHGAGLVVVSQWPPANNNIGIIQFYIVTMHCAFVRLSCSVVYGTNSYPSDPFI
jgi:hypothetical protein